MGRYLRDDIENARETAWAAIAEKKIAHPDYRIFKSERLRLFLFWKIRDRSIDEEESD